MMPCFLEIFFVSTRWLNRYIQSQKNPTNHVVTPVARLVVDIVWVARGFTHPCPAYVEAPATRKFLFTKWFPLFQLKQLWIRSYDINPTQKLLQGAHTFF